MSQPSENLKSNAELAREHVWSSPVGAKVLATLALADAIRSAAGQLSSALVEAARIKVGRRS